LRNRATQVVLNRDRLRLQQLAVRQQHPQLLTAQCLHMHRAIEPNPHHLRNATRIVTVGLVDLCLQNRPHVPRFNADHRHAYFGERTEQPLRQRPRFQSNPVEAVGVALQHFQQSVRLARNPHFPNDLARLIHNADAGLLDRYVQSSKMLHAALLLLMLGARNTVTPFHHQPEAQHPKSSPIHKLPADYPI